MARRLRGFLTDFRLAILVIALLAVSCGSAATATVGVDPDTGVPILDAAALQVVFDEWADGITGGGVAAIRLGAEGELVLLATGEDASSGELLTVDAQLRVGSVSKMFVAVLVLQMVEDGAVELDAPVTDYLPDTRLGVGVTVRQLLSHRSGIPDYTDGDAFIPMAIRNPDNAATPEDILSFVSVEDAESEPGTRFSYSNTNYIIAGQLIEAVSGVSLNDQLAARIVEPLGLMNTYFDDGTSTTVASGHAVGLPGGVTGDWSYVSLATSAWAAGALISTVEDLSIFMDAMMTGEIISEESFEMMRDGVDGVEDYGLGLHMGGQFGLGHGGRVPGFVTGVERNAETGDLLIVVSNNDVRDPFLGGRALWRAATN